MLRTLLVCVTLLLTVAAPAFPQSEADTSFLIIAKKNIVHLYRQAMGAQSRLYNGSKYRAPEHTLEEHPYFSSADWIMGSAIYDGEYFDDIPLMYDLTTGALITEHRPSGHAIRLVYAKLGDFSIGPHSFERIENESVANTLPKSGFYHVLYPGETKVIARRHKTVLEKIASAKIEILYRERNTYFVFRNGAFFSVRSKASMLKLLGNKKRELKKFVKEKGLPFSSNRELLLKEMAEHYDSLK